jgi:polysaccharide export outer membrane protein
MRALLWLALPLAAIAQIRPNLMEEVGRENLPAQKLGVDDLVAVSVYDAPELTRTVRVEADGTVHLPLLQEGVAAGGKLPRELERAIAEALKTGEILVDPVVKVTVVEYHSRPIAVMGAVKKPLTFQSVGTVTLLDALARAEGLTAESGASIILTRAPGDVERIPVKQLMRDADPSVNFLLHGGEEVRVPEAEKVFVVGNVRRSGAFPVRDPADPSVLKLIALAEGLMPYSSRLAYVYRDDGSGAKQEIPIELQKILERKVPDVPLLVNDVLYIPDNKGKRTTAEVLNRLAGFGSTVGSGLIVWH